MTSKDKQNPSNPSSFSDALTEKYYAQKSAKRRSLKRERGKLIDWLRKKAKYKSSDEALEDFIRRHGGINRCVAKLSRLGRNQAPHR